jgi:trigger factor
VTGPKQVLRTDVWVDGVRYHVGTIPPASVAEQITNPKAWTDAPSAPHQAEEPASAPPVADGVFEPGDHSVAEVKAHLDAADDAEKERVLEAERAGKARTTLTG